jgi:hypothetical protein
MRTLGYILLIVGFLILLGYQVFVSKQAALVVIWQQREHLPKQESFTPKQMDDVIQKVAFDTRRMLSVYAIPAIAMLCGGVLLDRANRRRDAYVA